MTGKFTIPVDPHVFDITKLTESQVVTGATFWYSRGQEVKYHLSRGHKCSSTSYMFPTRDIAPSLPPSKLRPRPVLLPSSHHPHKGLCNAFSHDVRSVQRVATKGSKQRRYQVIIQRSETISSYP